MARNKVQFQKGLSEAQFAILYGTEDQCREAVMRWRWPSGFVCPVCGGKHHSLVKTRAVYQCTACRRQTSLIVGTIFAATKVPLARTLDRVAIRRRFEWRATRCNFKRGSARPSLRFVTEQRISAGRR